MNVAVKNWSSMPVNLHRAWLLKRLDLVPGNAELFVLQHVQAVGLLVENGHQLRRFVDGFVAESAAPGDGGSERLAIERSRNLDGHLVVLREFQFLGDVEVAVTKVEGDLGGRGQILGAGRDFVERGIRLRFQLRVGKHQRKRPAEFLRDILIDQIERARRLLIVEVSLQLPASHHAAVIR